jgi:hypothetical protein
LIVFMLLGLWNTDGKDYILKFWIGKFAYDEKTLSDLNC